MWKNYSAGYFKNNRAMMAFIMTVAFFAGTLISFISHYFYNLFEDYIYRSYLKTGTHEVPVSTAFVIYTVIMILTVISLVLMIYHTFAVSMSGRIHHLGVLKSIGATSGQLKSVLIQETMGICCLPVLLGNFLGVGMAYLIVSIIIDSAETVRTYEVNFVFGPGVLLLSAAISFFTIGVSAWIPARKISRISVMDAIFNRENDMPCKIKKFRLFSALFGIEGELARKSLYTRRKSLRTAGAALFLAVMGFYVFMNTEKVSALSVQETYFNRYKDVWDYMVTFQGEVTEKLSVLERAKETEGISSCILYGRGNIYVSAVKEDFSKELLELGGPESISGSIVKQEGEDYLLEIPVIVLDDDSFKKYAGNYMGENGNVGKYNGKNDDAGNHNIGNNPVLGQGVILVNRIWDSLHSSRFEREVLPFLEQSEEGTLELSAIVRTEEKEVEKKDDSMAEKEAVKIMGYTDEGPALREELSWDRPTIVMSISCYEGLHMSFLDRESFLTVMTDSREEDQEVKSVLQTLLSEGDEMEGRVDAERSDESMRRGLKLIVGIVAAVLSCVGLSNVFSVALGQIVQRKREFARYLSIGLSPKGMKKILYIEALEISLKPILISILFNVPFVIWILKQSGVTVEAYLQNMPFYLIFLFSFGIVFVVCLTYYIGGRKILSSDLVEVLKDERICG